MAGDRPRRRWGCAGAFARAEALHEECLDLARAVGDVRLVAYSLLSLGILAERRGDPRRAAALLRESLGHQSALHGRGVAECLEGLAAAACAQGQAARGARLFGAAAALRETIGAPMDPPDRAYYAAGAAAARAAAGDAAFAAAQEEGRALSPEQAVAYALEENPDTA